MRIVILGAGGRLGAALLREYRANFEVTGFDRKQLDLSLDELTVRLGLSRATVAQRKAAGRLTSDESGKVVCFARLLGHAVHLFGDLEEARQWLKTPQRGLHGAVPLDYAKTEMGAQEVENLLSQLGRGSPA